MRQLGRYQLIRTLGRGGMGTVYEGLLIGPGGYRKSVAVKVLEHGQDALRREARIGGLLRHRNLVDVYEVADHEGTWFAAMELCRGGALSAHLPLPPRSVVEVGLQVCAALHYAHDDLGLVHLDLKPDNLLLTQHGIVKVADLGIARAEGFGDDGRIRGTVGYMSPEQARGDPLDARADIYALGVTLVELATGSRTAVHGTLDWSLEERNQEDKVRPAADPSSHTYDMDAAAPAASAGAHGAIPAWLAPVANGCLAPDPAQRFQSMRHLADKLRELQVTGQNLRSVLGLHGNELADKPRPDGNLGDVRDGFVGRVVELKELSHALQAPGVVLLKGPAGIGKSRLAAVAATTWGMGGHGQTWRCDLTEARTLDGLHAAVAGVLEVPLGKGDRRANTTLLGDAIAGRGPTALILDGFEHLAALTPVVAAWASRAPKTRILLTSRSAHPLLDATVIEVGPLNTEDAQALLVARGLRRGVELAQHPRLAELAAQLEGVPLALELAAGRLGVLSIDDVLERLGLSLLRAGTDDRHGTLRAALDWSWQLLSPVEKQALAQLSTFSSGFTLDAVEVVLHTGQRWPVDLVTALLDKSLVRQVAPERFDLLSVVQEYAAEQLLESSETPQTEVRHGHWVRSLRRRLGPDGSLQRINALRPELDNLVSATHRALARSDESVAVEALDATWEVLELTGPFTAAMDLAVEVARSVQDPGLRARAALTHALTMTRLGHMDQARHDLESLLEQYRANGDELSLAIAQAHLGSLHLQQGRMGASRTHLNQALASFLAQGNRRWTGLVHGSLGILDHRQGQMEDARAHYQTGVAIHRELGDRQSEGHVLGGMGVLHLRRGELDLARAQLIEAQRVHHEVGDRHNESVVLGNLAILMADLGQLEQARERYQEALTLSREIGHRVYEGVVLANLAGLNQREGRLDEARTFYDAARVVHQDVGDRRGEAILLSNLGTLHAEQGRLDVARRHFDQALLVHAELNNLEFEGWTLVQLAHLDARTQRVDHALKHLERAQDILEQIHDLASMAELLAVRAEVQFLAGDPGAAASTLGQAIDTNPPGHTDARQAIERAHALIYAQER